MNAIIKELSSDSVAVVVFFNERFFTNQSVRESIAQQMQIMGEKTGKIFIALPVGTDVDVLSGEQLKAIGLMRVEVNETTQTAKQTTGDDTEGTETNQTGR